MAVRTATTAARKVPERRTKKPVKQPKKRGESEFVCTLQFMNKLPELPYDPKFLKCPLEDSRHSTYRETSLERDYKFELLTGIDVGVTLDLVDMSSFAVPKNPTPLDPMDQQLIAGSTKQGGKQHTPAPFILHPQYSTSDSYDKGMPLGVTLPKEHREAVSMEDDQEKQIANINGSFDAALVAPKHPTNAKLKPLHIFPLLPDEDLWGNEYSEVVFDTDPVLDEEETSPEENTHKRKNAIIKSVSLPGDDTTCLRYFTPKRRRLDPDDQPEPEQEQEQEYEYIREYKYRLYKGEGENFLFVMKEGEVTYQEVRTKVMMQKVTKESNPYGQGRIFLKKLPTLSENAQQQLENARVVLQDASAQSTF